MTKIIIGLVLIISGCISLVFRDWIARESVEMKNRQFGLSMGRNEISTSLVLVKLAGIAFLILGILVLLGIVSVSNLH